MSCGITIPSESAVPLRDTAYKAIYAREGLTRKNAREPTLMEIAQEIGISKEDITYALDAIQSPGESL